MLKDDLIWLLANQAKIEIFLTHDDEATIDYPDAIKYVREELFPLNQLDEEGKFELLNAIILSFLETEEIETEHSLGGELRLLTTRLKFYFANQPPISQPAPSAPPQNPFYILAQSIHDKTQTTSNSIHAFLIRVHSVYAHDKSLLGFIVDIVLPLWAAFLNTADRTSPQSIEKILTAQQFPSFLLGLYDEEMLSRFKKYFEDPALGGPSGTNFQVIISQNLPTDILERAQKNCPQILQSIDQFSRVFSKNTEEDLSAISHSDYEEIPSPPAEQMALSSPSSSEEGERNDKLAQLAQALRTCSMSTFGRSPQTSPNPEDEPSNPYQDIDRRKPA